MIAFISNYLNHHQLEVCLELAKRDKFYFIATTPTPAARLALGYADMNNEYDFVIRMYESDENVKTAQSILDQSDFVIAGSRSFPFDMIRTRLEQNKLTFWFSERLFKRSALERFYPPKMKRIITQCTKYRNSNFFLLCAGGYVAKDYAFYNAFRNKRFNWGYFPPTIKTENVFDKKSQEKLRLLWTGRYLKWKHPEYAIIAAKALKSNNIEFELKMIGIGAEYDNIAELIKKNNLEDCVFQVGSVPAEEVREYMTAADIFLFTSDRQEGWGAVLNESMNSGCAVVANSMIGGAKSVIVDGENGILYNNKKQFVKAVLSLAKNPDKVRELGQNAYTTITELWSAENAAKRLYDTAMDMINGRSAIEYESGPMCRV